MRDIQGSYSRVNYLLRPGKQVERKLIIEAVQKLSPYGYNIPAYRYVGMGSIYYVDFVLFYKHLHITEMLCVEARPIERRMNFNKPYEFVSLHMGPVAGVIPSLPRDRPHFVWLDYDYPLNEAIINDLSALVKVAAPGSIVLTTVTAQLMELDRATTSDQMSSRSHELAAKYSHWFAPYIEDVKPAMLTRKNLPSLYSKVLRNLFVDRVRERQDHDLDFLPIFNYRYADGQSMLTFGGLIDTPERLSIIRDSSYLAEPFASPTDAPMGITVPQLTVREKHWLDQNGLSAIQPKDEEMAFELARAEIDNYAQFAKYYPIYYETLV